MYKRQHTHKNQVKVVIKERGSPRSTAHLLENMMGKASENFKRGVCCDMICHPSDKSGQGDKSGWGDTSCSDVYHATIVPILKGLNVSSCNAYVCVFFLMAPQWSTVDTEINISSTENPQLLKFFL